MYQVKQPFYRADESDIGGDWGEVFSRAAMDSGDDVQPEEDTEPEAEEEQEDASEDVVEPDTDEESEEEQPEEEPESDTPTITDDTEIDLGEGKQAVKLSELKAGYLRQSDYTKKTQALADERKAFESEKTEYEPLKGMNDFLNSNPWLAQQINTFIQEFSQTGSISLEDALQDATYGQHLNYLMAENKRLSKENESLTGKVGDMEFTGTFRDLTTELKAEYGDLVTDEYITSLQQRAKDEKLSTTSLRDIAEAQLAKKQLEQLRQESKQKVKQTQAKTVQELQEQRKRTPAAPKSQGQRPSKDDTPTDGSWFEALRAAAKR